MLTELKHPLRRQLLPLIIETEPTSPRQLAEHLGYPLSNVAYHVRVLHACGSLELVAKRPSRGSVEHFYRAAVKPELALEALRRTEDSDDGEKSGEEIS